MTGWLDNNRWKLVRRSVQILVIVLLLTPAFGFGFFQGTLISGELFGVTLVDPLAALDYTLAARVLSASVLTGAIIVVAFYFVVGGRVFCSWACPIHLVSEIAGRLRSRFAISHTGGPTSRRKYWILAAVIGLSLVTARPVFEVVSPIGAVTQNIALGARPDAGTAWAGVDWESREVAVLDASGKSRLLFNVSLLLVVLIALMELFVAKGWWCARTCPVGALYALVGRWSPVRIRIDNEMCNQCGDCLKVCMVPEVLEFPVKKETNWVLSGDCSNCLNCVDACTQRALTLRFLIAGRK